MYRLLLSLLTLGWLLVSTPVFAQVKLSPSTNRLLKELDKVVEQKMEFRKMREDKLNEEKGMAAQQTGRDRQRTLYRIFKNYARFQTDSAIVYLEKMYQTDPANDKAKNLYYIGRAEIYAVTGSYAGAQSMLKGINAQELDHETRLEYYHQCRTLYGWMTEYAVLPENRNAMMELTNTYRDSILLEEVPGVNRNIVLADLANVHHRADSALKISLNDTAKAHHNELTFIHYNIAVAYGLQGNLEQQMAYMARAAIADLRNGTTEYEALPRLAQLCYENNNPERAYRYLVCSMEDAAFCKARLRSVEASSIFPIIDRAYKKQVKERDNLARTLIYGLCMLAIILVMTIVSLRSQMKRLSFTRKQLALANSQMEKVNKNLMATAKVKEEYIARYLERCRSYIDALESFRRSLLKRFKAHQMEELYKELKSESAVQHEQERFLEEFDNAFLNLYPDFVEQLNALLLPEGRLEPKSGELLNTELRIFALIRLGVTDSQRIAHFLNYSVATIYCYRSKVRHKAIGDNTLFEQKVMDL